MSQHSSSHHSKHKSSRYKGKSRKSSEEIPEKTNLVNFSFLDYKNIFEEFIFGYRSSDIVLENLSDFWSFVNKYESLLKRSGQPILIDPFDWENYATSSTNKFHKRLCSFIEFDYRIEDVRKKIPYFRNEGVTLYKVLQFFEIVLSYLDFKQKEKFNKLKKLRKTQSSLPVYGFKREILSAVAENQVVVIAGDTGCGKSTQVPQYLHQSGFRNVACTQPRRLACVSLSKRVAHEMLCEYESRVGYQIRFEKSRTSKTEICFITEGLLLRQLALDAQLDQYDAIILDEIHERNLYGDFLLGVAKCLLRAKPEMKLILMSATINISLFSNYFKEENVTVIEVPGRLYPIKTYYMPTAKLVDDNKYKKSTKSDRFNPEPYVQIMRLIDQKYDVNEKGDVLMFVSGVNEVSTIIDAAREYIEQNDHWIILPLHSGLSLADQDKVFDYAPEGIRKCIVSTNIAETSLTVDGVRFVVDSGKVKEMSYEATSKISRLKEFWVSKSSAEQRKGRAGRTGPGVCYRLYSEKDFNEFDSYSTPEIHRVPLESILLQMISMGLPDVRIFPFVESPPAESIERAVLSLKQHEALSFDEKITPLGRTLSTLPVDISIGKMLLMGCVFQQLQRILTLAAVLSVQSPFTSRAFKDFKCIEARTPFESDQGDAFTLLNLFKEWLEQKSSRSENTKKWCHQIGIEEQRFYEITKLRHQFDNILQSCNILEAQKDEMLSSAERAIRKGEVRNLRAIKRAHKMEAPRKRKLLKRSNYGDDDDHGYVNDQEDDRETSDIRDVEFRLRNDPRKMRELLISSIAVKHRDVIILKVIIVSGLYPQIAIPDEFNYCKSASQQFFHTFAKPFVCLHPNGQFSKSFELLKLSDSDIVSEKPTYYTPRQPLSSVHQILCYQTLLETTKPYLLNCIRMPAAQTLLLFSYTIDTNKSITRIVCDTWLLLEFPIPETGTELLLKAVQLRHKWKKFLSKKLENFQQIKSVEEILEKKDKNKEDENGGEYEEFWNDLINFMSSSVNYTIKRLLPADVKNLYNHLEIDMKQFKNTNPFIENYEIQANCEKGGVYVTENVVYGCIVEEKWSALMDEEMSEHKWVCRFCKKEKPMTGISKLVHKMKCKIAKQEKEYKDKIKNKNVKEAFIKVGQNSKKLICEKCKNYLNLSSIEMLRHRRDCKGDNGQVPVENIKEGREEKTEEQTNKINSM